MELYLVTKVRHNAETGGLVYKTELATNNLSEAKEKFHALCEDFNKPTFDFVSVFITDAFGNKIASDYDDSMTIVTE